MYELVRYDLVRTCGILEYDHDHDHPKPDNLAKLIGIISIINDVRDMIDSEKWLIDYPLMVKLNLANIIIIFA